MRRGNHIAARIDRNCLAAGIALAAGAMTSVASAQWVVVNLHPAGATASEVHAIDGAEQVGISDFHALLWSGSAPSVRRLDPIPGHTAAAEGVSGGHQGGSVTVGVGVNAHSHAALWSGAALPWVDLHDSNLMLVSQVFAVSGNSQVGSFLGIGGGGGTFSAGRPCMWSGTPESFVDLTPVGIQSGEVHGVFGNQQVGAHFDNFLGTACMWSGSAESFVILQPEEAIFSAASCTDGEYQYGVIGILDPVPGLFPVRWHGTAESWELLGSPADHWGEVHATHAGYQVGYITDTDGVTNSRACIWTSGPGSYLDLQQFLPAPLSDSNALGVWRHSQSGTTYVVGYATNTVRNQREAVMWVNGPGTNLITSPVAPADDSVGVGGDLAYTVRVLNAGPDSSGPVSLTIDLPPASVATFAGASLAPTSVSGTQVVFTLGAIAGQGAFTDVSITLTATGSGATSTITATALGASEADPTNNTASASTHIQVSVCRADFNHDGDLNPDDLGDYITCYFTEPPCAAADYNADGEVNPDDLGDYITAFFLGC